MWPNPQFPTDLVTFTEKIFNGKLRFCVQWNMWNILELSGLVVCLVQTCYVFIVWRTEKVAGFWFARGGGGISIQADSMPNVTI